MDKHPVLNILTLNHYAQLTNEKNHNPRLTLSSPATSVMTDLRNIKAVTIYNDHTISQAHNLMIARAIRLLFIFNHDEQFIGVITANDILGEKPIALHKRHTDILVSEIMQEKNNLKALDYQSIETANIGSLIATMKKIGSQHVLVVKSNQDHKKDEVIGLISTSQIANLVGLSLPSMNVSATNV